MGQHAQEYTQYFSWHCKHSPGLTNSYDIYSWQLQSIVNTASGSPSIHYGEDKYSGEGILYGHYKLRYLFGFLISGDLNMSHFSQFCIAYNNVFGINFGIVCCAEGFDLISTCLQPYFQ